MHLDVDSGKLLYALGILFVAAALLYFVRDVVFGLSVTVKAALLFVLFVGFFLTGVTIDRDVLDAVAFALSGVSYVVWLGYVIVRFDPGEVLTFLSLAASGALFVGLGYLLRERDVAVSRRAVGYAAVGLLAVSVVLVGADAAGGGVVYAAETNETVTVTAPSGGPDHGVVGIERRIGTVTATNEFVFRRTLALPDPRGCLVGTESPRPDEVSLSYEPPGYERADTIAGGTSREFALTAELPVDTTQTASTTYRIERGTDCRGERETPTLVLDLNESTG